MVDHLTSITVDAPALRANVIGRVLRDLGFSVRPMRRGLQAESSAMEPGSAKVALRAAGILDREYRVRVEFARQWGVL